MKNVNAGSGDERETTTGAAAGASAACSHALDYAARGWHVFPCRLAPQKGPMIPKEAGGRGYLDATTDPEQIRAWWRRWPDAQIGVATGASHLVVIDLDLDAEKGKNGPAVFDAEIGVNPHGAVLVVKTPRGGRHLYYSDPSSIYGIGADVGGLIGVDVRGVGGYVIAPSPASPRREWIAGDPLVDDPDPPNEHVVHLLALNRNKPVGERGRGRMTPAGTADELRDGRMAEVRSALYSLSPSIKRPTWLQLIFAANDALGADERGADLVEEWSATTTVAGQYKPGEAWGTYSVAVLPKNAKPGHPVVTAETLFGLARDAGWKWPPAEPEPAVDVDMGASSAGPEQAQDAGPEPKESNEDDDEDDEDDGDVISVKSWGRVAEMESPEWQIEGWLPEQSLGLIAGPPSAAKSFVLLDIAMRMVHGMPFQGLQTKPGSVLFLCGEGYVGMGKRMRAWRLKNGFGDTTEERMSSLATRAEGRYLAFGNGIPTLTTKEGRKHLRDIIRGLIKESGHAPSLVIVDTISQAFGDGDENDAMVVSPALRSLSRLRTKHGCSVISAHHLTKNPPANIEQFTLAAVRGSGAFVGNVDVVWGLLAGASGVRTMKALKIKDDEMPQRVSLQLESVETERVLRDGKPEKSAVLVTVDHANASADEQSGSALLVMDALRAAKSEGCTVAQLLPELSLPRSTVCDTLSKLVESGHAERNEKRPYRYWATGYRDGPAKSGAKSGPDPDRNTTGQTHEIRNPERSGASEARNTGSRMGANGKKGGKRRAPKTTATPSDADILSTGGAA